MFVFRLTTKRGKSLIRSDADPQLLRIDVALVVIALPFDAWAGSVFDESSTLVAQHIVDPR
jgi:hypothetical protein